VNLDHILQLLQTDVTDHIVTVTVGITRH